MDLRRKQGKKRTIQCFQLGIQVTGQELLSVFVRSKWSDPDGFPCVFEGLRKGKIDIPKQQNVYPTLLCRYLPHMSHFRQLNHHNYLELDALPLLWDNPRGFVYMLGSTMYVTGTFGTFRSNLGSFRGIAVIGIDLLLITRDRIILSENPLCH